MEIEQLCVAFKKEGKQLNRVVHHASKMDKVFNDTERRQLIRLNKCLTDLMSMLRSDIDKGSIMTVKRMIQAFVSEATGVLQMIEQKNNPGKPVQEQTVFGVGPVSDSREYDIPIKCPDKMSRDQVLIIQALFSPAVGSDAKDSILRKIVYPYCLDNGLRQNALNKLYEYMTGEKTDSANETELQDNFEHYEYYLEFLYPPAAGEIVSDTKAYITFDSDCSYIKNLKDTKRPADYVQLKVEVSIDGGKFSAKLVSPQQSKSFDIMSLDMNDLGEWYDTSKNRSQFVTVQEGFFDKFKKKNGSSKANFDHGYLIIDDDPEIKLFLTDDEEISAGHNTDKWYDSSKITPKEYLIAERESTDSSEWCAMIGLLKDSGELAIVLRGSDEDVRLYPLKTDSMSEVKEMFKSGKHISKDYSVQEGFFDKFKKRKKTLDEYVDEFERQCDCKLRDEIRQFLTTPSKELDSIWCSSNRGIEGTKLYICATYDAKSLDDKISIGLYEDHKLITIMLVTDYSNDSETGDTTVLSINNEDGAIYETTDETGRNYRNYGKIADSLDDLKSKLEKYKY